MEEKTVVEEFRKLEQEFGPEKTKVLMDFILKYNESRFNELATKSDIANIKTEFNQRFSEIQDNFNERFFGIQENFNSKFLAMQKDFNSIVLKFTGILVAQAALIIALLKLL